MAILGAGTRFQFSDTPTPSGASDWTDVSSIVDLKPPKLDAEDVDTTVLDSPEFFETYIPGWANAGEAGMTIQYDKTQQATLFGLFRVPKGFRIMFPDGPDINSGSTVVFPGYIKTYANETPRKTSITAEITVKVSGPPVFTAADDE